MSLQAYQKVQRNTENPRNTEYRIFALVTRAMMDSRERPMGERVAAIDWNRRLWFTLQADLVNEHNCLPERLKAQLISLALWVDSYSVKVMRGAGDIQAMIDVNRSIMEGLANNVAPHSGVIAQSQLAQPQYIGSRSAA